MGWACPKLLDHLNNSVHLTPHQARRWRNLVEHLVLDRFTFFLSSASCIHSACGACLGGAGGWGGTTEDAQQRRHDACLGGQEGGEVWVIPYDRSSIAEQVKRSPWRSRRAGRHSRGGHALGSSCTAAAAHPLHKVGHHAALLGTPRGHVRSCKRCTHQTGQCIMVHDRDRLDSA
eukprot:1139477-Pelagomonas_calceolata.AAC.9